MCHFYLVTTIGRFWPLQEMVRSFVDALLFAFAGLRSSAGGGGLRLDRRAPAERRRRAVGDADAEAVRRGQVVVSRCSFPSIYLIYFSEKECLGHWWQLKW